MAKSHTLIEFQFFSIDYHILKHNRSDIFTNYPPGFAFIAAITYPNMCQIIDTLLQGRQFLSRSEGDESRELTVIRGLFSGSVLYHLKCKVWTPGGGGDRGVGLQHGPGQFRSKVISAISGPHTLTGVHM